MAAAQVDVRLDEQGATAPVDSPEALPVDPAAGAARWGPGLVCLLLYVVAADVNFGHLSTLGSSDWMVGPRNADEIAQVWWLAWAEFAITHGHNLFFTNWQNYPFGLNFGVNGSMFALGVPLAPITAHFGPVVTWNLLLRSAPVVSAFSMCLVLRRVTRWWPASFVGGLLYGFSAYATFNAGGYLFLAFVPLPPVMFLFLHEVLSRQRWKPIVTGAVLGALCGVQYLISSEILASTVLMGATAVVLYLLWLRSLDVLKTPYVLTACASATVTGVVALGYPVGYTFFGPQRAKGPPNPPRGLAQLHGDLLGPIVPSYLQRFTTSRVDRLASEHLVNSPMMYLGVPFIIAVIAIVILLRRRGIVVLAGAMAAVALILSLGSVLYIDGTDTHIPLPFVVLANLPLSEGLLSTRLSLFTVLFGAVVVAIGVEALHQRLLGCHSGAPRPERARRPLATVCPLLVALVVALPLLPSRTEPESSTAESAFFRSPGAEAIPAGSVVLAYPYPGAPFAPTGPRGTTVYSFAPVNNVLVDQAVAGMHFKLVGGYGWRPTKGTFGSPRPARLSPSSVQALFNVSFFGVATPAQRRSLATSNAVADLRTFLRRYRISTVVVLPLGHDPAAVIRAVTAAIGAPVHEPGATVWFRVPERLAAPSPG